MRARFNPFGDHGFNTNAWVKSTVEIAAAAAYCSRLGLLNNPFIQNVEHCCDCSIFTYLLTVVGETKFYPEVRTPVILHVLVLLLTLLQLVQVAVFVAFLIILLRIRIRTSYYLFIIYIQTCFIQYNIYRFSTPSSSTVFSFFYLTQSFF